MKLINLKKGNISPNVLLLVSIIALALMAPLIFLQTVVLITGTVYPMHSWQQQMLRTWGIEPFFIPLMWLDYLLPLFTAVIVTYKLRKHDRYLVTSAYVVIGSFILLTVMMNYFDVPIVVVNIVITPYIGWIFGQETTKLVTILSRSTPGAKRQPLPPPPA